MFCLKRNEKKSNETFSVDEESEIELVSILYDVTDKNHTYCGFKPIALAMLTGKLHLTKTLLKKNKNVINEKISGIGNLLTLLLNPVYNLNLSYEKLSANVDLLLGANLNPLNIFEVNEFRGNIYDYYFILTESEKYSINCINY